MLNHFGARADESYPSIDHRLREIRPLRQEAITGVNSVHVILFRDFDDFRDIQVSLDRWQPSANHVTLVGFLSVHLHLVLFRIDGHRPDSQFRACSKHTDRDFSCENNNKSFILSTRIIKINVISMKEDWIRTRFFLNIFLFFHKQYFVAFILFHFIFISRSYTMRSTSIWR